jgi:hypothetical protein
VTINKLSAHFYRLRIYWLITEEPEELLLWYPDGDGPRWTPDEEEQLRACFPDKEKLMAALPKRTWASILHHAYEKGLTCTNPRLSRAAYMAFEDLLTNEDREVMIYCGIRLDEVSRSKPVSLLWSRMHDNRVSIITNPYGQ